MNEPDKPRWQAGTAPERPPLHGAPIPQVGGDPVLACVLFDAGSTLLNVVTPSSRVACVTLRRHSVGADPAELGLAMAWADDLIESQWREGDWFTSEAGVQRLYVGSYAQALMQLPSLRWRPDRAASIAQAMYEEYGRACHWALYQDVIPTLEALRLAGVAMGVVSDWGHGLEGLLLEHGLGTYLDSMVVSARLGLTKPDPSVFVMALDRVGVDSRCTVYVGDTYVKDVLGARAAGIMPVLLDRQRLAPDMDCQTIQALTDLLPLVGIETA